MIYRIMRFGLIVILVISGLAAHQAILMAQDLKEESSWEWLFDGNNIEAWTGVKSDNFPVMGWSVIDRELVVNPANSAGRGGDIITKEAYNNFDLEFEFKLTEGANTGIKYFVRIYPNGSVLGCEYQLIDDFANPDIRNEIDGKKLTAGLYELFEASNKTLHPAGQWNSARIIVQNSKVQHWLNGTLVLEYNRGDEAFMKAKAASKFRDIDDFGTVESGYILLQDHGDRAYFRNIRIKRL